jgi:hypothetical protein
MATIPELAQTAINAHAMAQTALAGVQQLKHDMDDVQTVLNGLSANPSGWADAMQAVDDRLAEAESFVGDLETLASLLSAVATEMGGQGS